MINQIDIVSNIRILNPQRLKYFLAVLKSYEFLKDHSNMWLNIENGEKLIKPISKLLKEIGYKNFKVTAKQGNFGDIYMEMLNQGTAEYVINMEDDHFCQMSSLDTFFEIINFANKNDVDTIHGTFFYMIQDLYKNIEKEYEFEHASGFRLTMDQYNQLGWTPNSIYNGTNCIFKREYAMKFWGEKHDSVKPHPFEKKNFAEGKEINILILKTEFLRPIDDDHGFPDTCCIKSKDNEKWLRVWNQTSTKPVSSWISAYNRREKLKQTRFIRRFIK